MKKPNLFTYEDYRLFLKDWFAWMKETKPGYSYRLFSRIAGFKSPNQLLLVIQNQRNIALASINKYFQALKLKHSEQKYFECLVKFNQAENMSAKKAYFEDLSTHWVKRESFLENEQLQYLSNWYYAAVREMVNLKDFKENGAWISKKLGGLITPTQAQRTIEELLALKLIERDSNQRLVQTNNYVTTGDEIQSVAAFLYHEQMIKLALEALKEKSSTRNTTALTFTMTQKDYNSVVDKINNFRKEIVGLIQNREIQNQDEALYQLNIHLFPITKD